MFFADAKLIKLFGVKKRIMLTYLIDKTNGRTKPTKKDKRCEVMGKRTLLCSV